MAEGKRRVAYLLGAGATHASARAAGSATSLLMRGLSQPLRDAMRDLLVTEYKDDVRVTRLVNELVTDAADLEQVITFLNESPSFAARQLSLRLQEVFQRVLSHALDEVERTQRGKHSKLYAVLLDMHEVEELSETLLGFLTLNYDRFLEHAIEHHFGWEVDYGLQPQEVGGGNKRIPVVKLHGSFYWKPDWPFALDPAAGTGHWIPPGIRKAKERWPFNLLWGRGRELLDCDVLRIVGCNLSQNDWDLVSLLFSTQQTHRDAPPYEVEIISSPATAIEIRKRFAFLNVRSLLELPDIGPIAVSESLGGEAKRFDELDEEQRENAVLNATAKARNALQYWLRLRAEMLNVEATSLATKSGFFQAFLEGAYP